jgi:proteasome alpha subunit
MLEEPYRWVEAIRNRREYLEDQLAGASPVIACRYADGLLLLTTTPGPRKIFEAYNQIAFAGVGHPADIEKLRKSVIDIAHLEAFNLSARDVSLQRLVNFGVGPLMKAAFDEIFRSPFIARVMVAELDPTQERETFYTVDADGSFTGADSVAVIAGTPEVADAIRAHLCQHTADQPLKQALRSCVSAWGAGRLRGEAAAEELDEPTSAQITEAITSALESVHLEAAVLDRTLPTKTKFRLLDEPTLAAAADAATDVSGSGS